MVLQSRESRIKKNGFAIATKSPQEKLFGNRDKARLKNNCFAIAIKSPQEKLFSNRDKETWKKIV